MDKKSHYLYMDP